jgi:hypothetical protein
MQPSIDQSAVCYPTKLSAGRKEIIRAMNKPEEIRSEAPQAPAPPSHDPAMSSRRELIERYAKYAVVAAPLLVFVSKAHAIHSKP